MESYQKIWAISDTVWVSNAQNEWLLRRRSKWSDTDSFHSCLKEIFNEAKEHFSIFQTLKGLNLLLWAQKHRISAAPAEDFASYLQIKAEISNSWGGNR